MVTLAVPEPTIIPVSTGNATVSVVDSLTEAATNILTVTNTTGGYLDNALTSYQKKVLWQTWNDCRVRGWVDTCTTSSSTTNSVWLKWNDERCTGWERQVQAVWHAVYNQHMAAQPQRQLTAEERARAREAAERAEIDRKARVIEIEAAKDRAQKLLMGALNDRQKTELKDKGYFHCKSQKGHLYRIYKGTHGNVKKLDPTGKKEIESLCIQPDNVPDWDAMLAQKLHIEYNEDDFRKTANISRLAN